MTGSTYSIYPNTKIYSNPSILTLFSNNQEILKVTQEGDLFYRHNDEMIKVNCPDDVVEAFIDTVFNYTGQNPEEIVINKYIRKILNHERSYEYISKIEKVIRKLKLEKINKN